MAAVADKDGGMARPLSTQVHRSALKPSPRFPAEGGVQPPSILYYTYYTALSPLSLQLFKRNIMAKLIMLPKTFSVKMEFW